MKILCLFLAVLAVVGAFEVGEYDEEMYVTKVTGKRAEAKDDAQSSVTCGKHYVMKSCECQDPETCDGSWIRSSVTSDECVVWTKAAGEDGKVIGAVPVATCVRLMVNVETDYGQNPSVSCPDKFARIGCNLHTHYRQHEKITMGVTQRDGLCATYGDCKLCKVQAICIRNKDV